MNKVISEAKKFSGTIREDLYIKVNEIVNEIMDEIEKAYQLGYVTGAADEKFDKVDSTKSDSELVMENNKLKGQLTEGKEIIRSLCTMVRELNKPDVQLTDVNYSLARPEKFIKELDEYNEVK